MSRPYLQHSKIDRRDSAARLRSLIDRLRDVTDLIDAIRALSLAVWTLLLPALIMFGINAASGAAHELSRRRLPS